MSWGTNFNTNIFIDRQVYSSKQEVLNNISILEEEVINSETKLKMLASSNINDICPQNWQESKIQWLNNEIDDILYSLKEDIITLEKLYKYIEFIEEKPENLPEHNIVNSINNDDLPF